MAERPSKKTIRKEVSYGGDIPPTRPKKLAAAFPDAAVATLALQALDRYGTRPHEKAADGVHLAIIKLSEGKLWRVRELVKKAKHDFRDVLYVAQAPEAFRLLRENPPPFWGELPRIKPLTPAKKPRWTSAIKNNGSNGWNRSAAQCLPRHIHRILRRHFANLLISQITPRIGFPRIARNDFRPCP